ncbi:MAG: ankyrin repeat domain-containing protein [Bacteroidales bacterium]|jgi:ankyrin repeat protein|nr:ankyrin repeat domain-containing protein [Bacteroidales bacterium]
MQRERFNMNKNFETKNKFLKNIALGSFLLGSFAGTSSQLQADPIHSKSFRGDAIAVQQLLNSGVDPNKKNTSGEAPLHLASTPEVINLLCDKGANPNIANSLGNTPLHSALIRLCYHENVGGSEMLKAAAIAEKLKKQLDCIQQLLRRGANKDTPNNTGYSPSFIVTQVITSGRFCDGQKDTPISAGVHQAYNKVQQLFSQVRTKSLHDAVAEDDIAEVRRLLDVGADPNEIDELGFTPLQHANTPETVDLLCNKGANINGLDRWSNSTPLRIAVSNAYPNLEVIKQLLRKGAKIDIKDKRGKTPVEAVKIAIKGGIVDNGSASTLIGDDARLAYAEVLTLFFLPQHLW